MTPDLAAALLAWAVSLSGYPAPAAVPEIAPASHAWLVEHACAGRECKVWGWYPHDGGTTVYLDARLDPARDTLAASVAVHELVHLLQQRAGKFGDFDACADSIALEREAYGVQHAFLTAYGSPVRVGLSIARSGCP